MIWKRHVTVTPAFKNVTEHRWKFGGKSPFSPSICKEYLLLPDAASPIKPPFSWTIKYPSSLDPKSKSAACFL